MLDDPNFSRGRISMKVKQERKDRTQVGSGVEKSFRKKDIFMNGVAVGLGIGCIAIFAILWVSIYFAPKLPTGISYENMLSIFFYPLIYTFAVGLVSITAGAVREHHEGKST